MVILIDLNPRSPWVLTVFVLTYVFSEAIAKSIFPNSPNYPGDCPFDPTPNSETKCARMWSNSNSCPLAMHFDRNRPYENLAECNFVPFKVEMGPECELTMIDDQGAIANVEQSVEQCWARPISFACCECSGCYGAKTPDHPSACAVVYEHVSCSACHGRMWTIQNGEEVLLMHPDLDKTISSVMVRPGCVLEVFNMAYFFGSKWNVFGIQENLGQEWNDQISSYRCSCGSETDEPPMTPLPPVNRTTPIPIITSTILSPTETTEPAKQTPEPIEEITTPEVTTKEPVAETTEPRDEITEPQKVESTTEAATSSPTTVITSTPEAIASTTHSTTEAVPSTITTTMKPETTTVFIYTTEESSTLLASSSTEAITSPSTEEDTEDTSSSDVTGTTPPYYYY